MTESESERPAHNPDDVRGGGGTGGGPGPEGQEIWEKSEARRRAEQEGRGESGDDSEPASEGDEQGPSR